MEFAQLHTAASFKQDGRVFISPNETLHPLGKLLLLINVDAQSLSGLARLDELVEFAQKNYYADKETPWDSPEAALESLLGKLNGQIFTFLPGLSSSETEKQIVFFIGALQNDSLYFSKIGQVKLLLKHGLALIDVLQQSQAQEEVSAEPGQIFSYLTSGKMSPDDTLLVTTSPLLDYFSENKLKQILNLGSADRISREFASLVEDFSNRTYFQSIIVKNTTQAMAQQKMSSNEIVPVQGRTAHQSMTKLNTLESKTGDLLAGGMWKTFKKNFFTLLFQIRGIFLADRINTTGASSDESIKRRLRQKSLLSKISSRLLQALKSFWLIGFWLFRQLWLLFANLFQRRNNILNTISRGSSTIPNKIQGSLSSSITRWRSLDFKRRSTLMGGLVLAGLLALSIAVGLLAKNSGVSREDAGLILDEIEVKKSSADAALIYGNEKQAASLIAEARRLLGDLKVSGNELKERKRQLAELLFETYKTVQKLEEVNEPALLVDLGSDDQGNILELASLTGAGSTFYGFTKNNRIYEFAVSQSEVNAIAGLDFPIKRLAYLNENQLLIYGHEAEPSLSIFNIKQRDLEAADIEFNSTVSEKADFETYFNRLYILDPRERQIFRHQLTGNGWGRGQPWIADTTADVSDGTAMAIDGNVWVATASGQIVRLAGGEKLEFETPALDPILNSPNFIWTSIDSSHIYVLDPPTRRVVVLDKDGTIFRQFVSERFDNLKSAAIDEANNKIYVLNHAQVYELDME